MKMAIILVMTVLVISVPTAGYPVAPNVTVEATRTKDTLPEYDYLERPEDEISLAEGALLIAKGLYPEIDVNRCLEQVETWTNEIKTRLQGNEDPKEICTVINTFLYDELGIEYQFEYKDDIEKDSTAFLHTVIETKTGTCMGLSMLYLALAERLGLPMFGIALPEHVLVRYDDGTTRLNIEPSLKGTFPTDEELKTNSSLAPEAVQNGVYMRSLGKKEMLGTLLTVRATRLRKAEEFERALCDLAQVERYIKTLPGLYYCRGVIYRKLGEWNRAIEAFTKALDLNPFEVLSFYHRSIAYQELGNYDACFSDISKAITIDAEKAYLYIVRGYYYQQKREHNKALEDYITAVALDPDMVEGYSYRSAVYQEMNAFEKAMDDINTAMSLAPDCAVNFASRGDIYYHTGEYEQALADFTRAIELSSGSDTFYRDRALVYLQLDMNELEMKDLNRAIEFNPDDSEAYCQRGTAWERAGEFEKAFRDYSRACSVRPDYTEAFELRGIAYYKMDKCEEAEKDLQRAAELDSSNFEVHRILGDICFNQQEDYDDAIQHYNRAINLNPECVQAYWLRGNAYRLMEDAVQACLDFSRVISLDPDFPEAYRRRADVLKSSVDARRAINDYLKVLEFQPEDPFCCYDLGVIYKALGETVEMVDYFKRYLLHVPDNEPGDKVRAVKEAIETYTNP